MMDLLTSLRETAGRLRQRSFAPMGYAPVLDRAAEAMDLAADEIQRLRAEIAGRPDLRETYRGLPEGQPVVTPRDALGAALVALTALSLHDAVPRFPNGPPYDGQWFRACEQSVEKTRNRCMDVIRALAGRMT